MNTWVEAPPRRKGLGCFARGCLQYGRLSLRKGEGEGEGFFRQVACAGAGTPHPNPLPFAQGRGKADSPPDHQFVTSYGIHKSPVTAL